MRNTKNAFTLVELIVVITILAILGTIAFISLQWYSADARNSKRTSDIWNIQSSISLKMVEWVPLMSFISDDSKSLTWVNLGWNVWVTTNSGTYIAWIPNYTVLNVVPKDFKDPKSDQDYAIGATQFAGWVFQVAATMEQDRTETARVNWTFNSRNDESYSGSLNGTVFTLNDDHANRFKVNDSITITYSGWTENVDTVVQKVSRDGVTLTLAASIGTDSDAEAWLVNSESEGLINGVDEDGVVTNIPVEDNSTNSLPY